MRVLVAGDLVIDHYVYEGQERLSGSTILQGARWISEPGGAGLLGRLLQSLATCGPTTGAAPTSRFVVDLAFSHISGRPARDGYCVMQPCCPQLSDNRKVWRVTRSLGFSPGLRMAESASDDGEAADIEARREAEEERKRIAAALDQPADVVVLDDAGLGFRRWPNRCVWPKFLREPVTGLPQWVVLKMSGPIAAGDLWHTIVSGHTQPDGQSGSPPPAHLGGTAERTILVVAIDELRREFVRVEGKLSWERAATDLIEDLETNVRLQALKSLRVLVVRFGLDGALVVDRSNKNEPRHTLIFDPAGIEGAFLANVTEGSVFGYQTCLTAAIVFKLMDTPSHGATPTAPEQRVMDGVRTGLSAMRRLVIDGHEPDTKAQASFPYNRITREIGGATPEWHFGSVVIPAGLARSTPWTIIAGATSHPPAPLWGLARRVAVHGIGQLTGIPYVQFAKLFSVDRSEIESLRALQQLLTSYMRDPKASRPLSIAAFGPPGSGKSFGIKQLAEALFDDRSPLEFNLSQFSTAAELHGLFHQVRDRVLQGQVPLVFWDEFDSRELYWLQYLLAPMQDGTFQDGQITHPIGRCVFVFAGGTRDRFEDFGKPPPPLLEADDRTAIQHWNDEFKMKKGTDFKSRLGGYVNVLGPNRRDAEDITYPLRRALLLRVHLGLKPTDPAAIDFGLLEAFLRVGVYHHGARSLEKIAEQVRLSSRTGAFNRSDLPPRQQLDLHVAADEFLRLVESV